MPARTRHDGGHRPARREDVVLVFAVNTFTTNITLSADSARQDLRGA